MLTNSVELTEDYQYLCAYTYTHAFYNIVFIVIQNKQQRKSTRIVMHVHGYCI